MIDRTKLLTDVQVILRSLEADLLERSESYEVPDVSEMLRLEYEKAKTAERTAQSYEEWRAGTITHIAAAWVLSCVFARFLEDNKLVDPPTIAGPDERLERARDEHELYFRTHPTETDREYLLDVFDRLAKLPGVKDIFGKHNPIHELPNWLLDRLENYFDFDGRMNDESKPTAKIDSAISAYYVDVQERLGGRDDPRLVPLLGCLIELLPWLKQWHNDIDPEYNLAMGDYFEGFIQEESRQIGKTPEEVRQWKPPQRTSRRRS